MRAEMAQAPLATLILLGSALGVAACVLVRRLPPWLLAQWQAQWQALGHDKTLRETWACGERPGRRAGWYSLACMPATLALTALCYWKFGTDMTKAIAALVFCTVLVVLAVIDVESQLLPDVLVLPLLWAGLWLNGSGMFVPAPNAISGAILGYALPCTVAWLYRQYMCRVGLGMGDFKLTAALGAWLGVESVFRVLLPATAVCFMVGILGLWLGRFAPDQPQPFGPYLAIAGVGALFLFAR